jgi:hypothetical protein
MKNCKTKDWSDRLPTLDRDSNIPSLGIKRVFDEFGREPFITKEQWRTSVLPGTLKSNWDNPDRLYGVIVGSLNDGFFADVLGAGEHLHGVDPVPARGACIYGIVLMENNRLDEAEHVLVLKLNNTPKKVTY